MIESVLVFAPGILAAALYCYLKKIPLRSVEFITLSVAFIFAINFFVISLILLQGHKSMPSNDLFADLSNVVLYGLISGASALLFPNILVLFTRIRLGKKHE